MADDLDKAVQAERNHVTSTLGDQVKKAQRLSNLGNNLAERYSKDGSIADLDEAIQVTLEAVEITPKGHISQAACYCNLGLHLTKRYLSTQLMSDLEELIRVLRVAVRLAKDDPNVGICYNNLANGLQSRYSTTGAPDDIEDAINFARKAVESTAKDDMNRATYYSNLGRMLYISQERTGITTVLDEAIWASEEALDATSMNHPCRGDRLIHLGRRLYGRYSKTGTVIDLERAIEMTQGAMNLLPSQHPDWVTCCANLASQLSDKHARTGSMAVLQEAIHSTRSLTGSLAKSHPDLGGILNNLGVFLSQMYSATGDVVHLDESIKATQEALEAKSEKDGGQAMKLTNLGLCLRQRYLRTNAMAELEEAIKVTQKALDLTPKHHRSLGDIYNNLGILLSSRYSRISTADDLEQAILFTRKAIEITPRDHPRWRQMANNLSNRLQTRAFDTVNELDLQEAAQLLIDIMAATQNDEKDWAAFSHNFGTLFKNLRFENGNIPDGIRSMQEAMDSTPGEDPDRASRFMTIAHAFKHRFSSTGESSNLRQSLLNYTLGFNQTHSPATDRVRASQPLIDFYARSSDWNKAYEISRVSISLIPTMMFRSLDNSDKQYILGKLTGLASDAAAMACMANAGPLATLSLLEQGRGVLASSLEELRSDVMALRKKYPELAEKFVSLRDELDTPIASNASSQNQESLWKGHSQQRYLKGQEFDQLIDQIRRKAEFKDFLLVPNEAEIKRAARHGPIVVINVSRYGCDAILIEQHQIRLLSLPDLTYGDIQKKAKEGRLDRPTILSWLWDVITNPVLVALGFTQPPSHNTWPRIWWIPTGPLSRFPLHASGHHLRAGSSDTVLDRVISSYSLSVKTIIRSQELPASSSSLNEAILVAMEHTPGHSTLPFAKKEVAVLQDLCATMKLHSMRPQCHKVDIIRHLPTCKIFHFAGHGCIDPVNPSRSRLSLEDWKDDPLTISTLLEINLRQHTTPFLAYLSACGTGRSDNEKLIDESIHLINGCQLAGFRHVIGTLWEVNDEICVDIAKITYEGMRDGGMTDESVSRGLHYATREIRDHWVRRQGNDKPTVVEVTLTGDDTLVPSSGQEGRIRDVEICDEDEMDLMYWVPYVHFGG